MLSDNGAGGSRLPQLKILGQIAWREVDSVTLLEQGEKINFRILQSALEVFAGCHYVASGACANQMEPKVVELTDE